MITVPTGVSSKVFSCCFQFSEPGATPGQIFTVCCALAAQVAASQKSIAPLQREWVLNNGPLDLWRKIRVHVWAHSHLEE
jgi:hypothetical protein